MILGAFGCLDANTHHNPVDPSENAEEFICTNWAESYLKPGMASSINVSYRTNWNELIVGVNA